MPNMAGSRTGLETRTSFVPAVETLDEEFARLAGEVPGGFAGFYLDSIGHLVVALTDVTQRDAAMNRLGETLRIHTGGRFASGAGSNVRFQHAEYPFDQLQDWRQKLFNAQPEGLVMVDVDEVSNRIVLGFDQLEGVENQLQKVLVSYAIPPNAVRAVSVERIQLTQSLVV